MFESSSYRSHPEHAILYDALEVSMDRKNREEFIKAMAKSRRRRRDDQDPPLPPSKDSEQSKKKRHDSDASASKQHPIKTRPDWLKLVPKEEIPETPEPDWVVPLNDLPETENNRANAIAKTKSKLVNADLEGPAYKLVRPFHKNNMSLQFHMEECHMLLTDQIDLVNLDGNRVVLDVSKPLPLGGPPGQVTIQTQYFFNKDLEYLVSGDKERRNALLISKLKVANYPDFGLEELVPSLWIESACVILPNAF
ncbi:hypothetical protein Tco_1036391 [Tanacetum coccineum]